MDWLTDRQFFLLAVIVYTVSAAYSIFLWQKGFSRRDRLNYALLLGGFVLHTVAMLKRGFTLHHCPVNNLYEATMFIGWTIAAAYLVFGLWPKLRFLSVFVAPVLCGMGVFALMPALDVHKPRPEFTEWWSSLHAALVLMAYGMFGLGAVAASMYLTQEHALKYHKRGTIFSLLPPIQRLDLMTRRLLQVGFVALTAGLIVGAQLAKNTGVSHLQDAKVVWSFLVWLAYLAMLIRRWRFMQSARRLAWGAIGVFVFLLLTFWGTNLLSELHNP